MDPNRYINERITSKEPVQSAAPINKEVKASIPTNNTANIHRKPPQKEKTGRLCISSKRFFGQILIDHWVIRINGEQRELPFGRNKLSLELPAGVYLVTAYTPYLGMHCMRVTADIEIRPGMATHISYQTVFDIFKNGIMRQSIS
jgi:hypothetical protein